MPLRDAAAGLLGHAGLRPQQVEPTPHLVQLGQHISGKFDTGNPLLQGCAQYLGRIDHTNAVWDDQVGTVEHLTEVGVFFRRQDKFRIGCHHIVELLLLQHGGAQLGSLLPGHVVKPDTQNIFLQSHPSQGTVKHCPMGICQDYSILPRSGKKVYEFSMKVCPRRTLEHLRFLTVDFPPLFPHNNRYRKASHTREVPSWNFMGP